MAKRKLTQRQMARARIIQANRINNINQSNSPEQPGLLIAHYGITVIVEDQAGKLFRCDIRQNLGALVTGDEVIWKQSDNESGVVLAVKPRRNEILRPNHRSIKPLAANIDQICVIISPVPKPQKTTIDRYLVMASTSKIDVLIILNKIDLLDTNEHGPLLNMLDYYENIGYDTIRVSTKTKDGLEQLLTKLHDKRSIFLGQSGVGKSSLLMALIPTAQTRIQELSHLQHSGKHTTTTTRLFHLPQNGDILDSPGTNQFHVYHLGEKEIAQGFKEFGPYLGHCRFRDCRHDQEVGCALQNAVENGKIEKFRLQNYFKLLTEYHDNLSRNGKS